MAKELTVVIPSYNMERYLPKCLESLGLDRLQGEGGTLADALEVIVVNDGSTDLVVNDYDEVGATGKVSKTVQYGLPPDAVFAMKRLADSNEMLDIHGDDAR